MKYLVGVPCLYGAGHTKEAIDSVIKKDDVDVLLIDNGAEQSVKELLVKFSYHNKNVGIIRNQENIYVNPAWNQIIEAFIKSDCDYLLIMNSDLILQKDWKEVLDKYLSEHPDNIPIPVITTDRNLLNTNLELKFIETEVIEGTPGVLICLNKKHAELIYPIPEQLKVWFGDNWIYDGLRKIGYKTLVLNNLISYHSGSQNVSKVKNVSQIIEQDKKEWAKIWI